MTPVRRQISQHPLIFSWLALMTLVLLWMILTDVPWSL